MTRIDTIVSLILSFSFGFTSVGAVLMAGGMM